MIISRFGEILVVVIPVVVFCILISLLVLSMACRVCSIITRLRKAYWRYNNAKKAREGDFDVQTQDNEDELMSNVIYKPRLSVKDPQAPGESDGPITLQKTTGSSGDDEEDTGQENKYESFEGVGQKPEELVEVHAEMSEDVGEEEETKEAEEDEQMKERITGVDDDFWFGNKSSEENNLQTSSYISMDRPKCGIRKCYTISGTPFKPYLINGSQTFEPFLRLKDINDFFDQPRNSAMFIPDKPVPVARCRPFRTQEDIELESNKQEDSKIKHPKELKPIRRKRESVAEVLPSPIITRKSIPGNVDLNDTLSDSIDDLFKEAWWKSTASLDDKEQVEEDPTPPPPVCKRNTSHIPSIPNSIYVKMDQEGTPRVCGTPLGDVMRCRSATLPNLFERQRKPLSGDVSSTYLSVWHPPNPTGDLQFAACELLPAPKPCFSSPEYVNFRGTLPMRL